ncbi:MAG: heme-binding protein [Acidobacteria bacterium]|nr:heme-binding protein [Acidobacteriota bacterium]
MSAYKGKHILSLATFYTLILAFCLYGQYKNPQAMTEKPILIDREQTVLDIKKSQLVIVGENFTPNINIELSSKAGIIFGKEVNIQNSNTIIVNKVTKADVSDGVLNIKIRNSHSEVAEKLAVIPSSIASNPLTEADIRQIIGQGIAAAKQLKVSATFAVLDREGNILALYQMKGAAKTLVVRDIGKTGNSSSLQGLEGLGGAIFPGVIPSVASSISKAGTSAFFSSSGNAFSTRSVAFTIREHFPAFINNFPNNEFFGVQPSSLGCSDVKQPGLPLGISGDTGGVPIYKNGVLAGGLGVEINGEYNVALNRPIDLARNSDAQDELFFREGLEEIVSFAAQRGFEPNDQITADKILVEGIRLVYRRKFEIPVTKAVKLESAGSLLPIPFFSQNPKDVRIRTKVPTEFRDILFGDKIVRVVPRFFPFRSGKTLTESDVQQILLQAIEQSRRGALRRPIDVESQVNVVCTDVDGEVLGLISNIDAPIFGFDASVGKARSATLFSRLDANQVLRSANLGFYADNLFNEGLKLDGQFAFSSLSISFIHRPFFPHASSNSTLPGPLSKNSKVFSPFNNGFQTDFLLNGANNNPVYKVGNNDLSFVIGRSLINVLSGLDTNTDFKRKNFFCDPSNAMSNTKVLNNNIMISSGGIPLFKDNNLVGAIGVSGDTISSDEVIAVSGTKNFVTPAEKRIDKFLLRGVSVPFIGSKTQR